MSRVFKSEQCIPATPCRLEPVLIAAETIIEPVGLMEQDVAETAVTVQPDVDLPVSAVSQGDAGQAIPVMNENLLAQAREEADAIREAARRQVESLLGQSREETEALLARTHSEADSLVDHARQAAEEIRETARRTGLAEGRQEGLQTVRSELGEELGKALAIVAEAVTIREERIAASEQELVKLAAAIAEKIIAVKIPHDGKGLRRIIGQALTKAGGAVNLKIRLHPDDLAVLEQTPGLNFQEFLQEPKTLQFEGDSGIAGGCFIETEMGQVDARVSSQLERVIGELLKVGRLS